MWDRQWEGLVKSVRESIQMKKGQMICGKDHWCLIGTGVGLVFHHRSLMGADVGWMTEGTE